ncbi:hypothetical protein ACQQ2N_12340 [Dokdonella sp. MW10]|uniref:hypothetical protein n=1 Tax=Dokdonella sp. MW10 TaxID=2992926 RepID=UPI003F7F5497
MSTDGRITARELAAFFAGGEGRSLSDSTTLGLDTARADEYLRNRVRTAWLAGWEAHKAIASPTPAREATAGEISTPASKGPSR